jgi:hypothetical protein
MKTPIDYSKRAMTIPMEDGVTFTAEGRVKLSTCTARSVLWREPWDNRVRRRTLTGEPKGLAIRIAPLHEPVRSGPMRALLAWGLTDLDELQANYRGNVITFTQDNLYLRSGPSSDSDASCLRVSFSPRSIGVGCAGARGRAHCEHGLAQFRRANGLPIALELLPRGPSDRRQGQSRANALQAIYPNFMTDEHAARLRSLDFEGPGQEQGPT